MKKYVILSLVLSLFLLPSLNHVKAQSSDIPNVFVQDIKLQKTDLKVGEAINGTFKVSTDASDVASDIYFVVSLVGDYNKNSNLPHAFYDSKISSSSYQIKAGETKTIDFSYTIPQVKTGTDYGIEIQGMTHEGLPLGWSDAFIKITNDSKIQLLEIKNAKLLVDKESFGLQVGPTVSNGQNVSLDVVISNPNSQPVTLIPTIDLYNRVAIGAPIKTITGSSTTIAASKQKEIVIPLPTDYSNPLVYVSQVRFVDSNGAQVAAAVNARYIVSGDIATIHTITTDKKSFGKGDTIAVTLGFSGIPYNIVTDQRPETALYDTAVTLLNDQNQPVASWNGQIDYNSATTTKTVSLTAEDKANGYTVDVVVTKAGRVITHYSLKIEPNATTSQAPTIDWLYTIVGFLIIVIIVIALATLIHRRKNTAAMLLFFLFIGGLACAVFGVGLNKVVAQVSDIVWTYQYRVGYGTNLTSSISSPVVSPSTVFSAGQSLTVSGTTVIRRECSNHPVAADTVTIEVFSYDETQQISATAADVNYGGETTVTSNYSAVITVPSTPGTYKIFRYINVEIQNDLNEAILTGYQTIVVVPAGTVSLTANPTSVIFGNSSTLTANAAGVTSCGVSLSSPLTLINAFPSDDSYSVSRTLSVTPSNHGATSYQIDCNQRGYGSNSISAYTFVFATYECLNPPSNATLCSSEPLESMSANANSTVVSACPLPVNKCEFTCNSGYVKSGNTCVAITYSCTGTMSGTQCPSPTDPSVDTAWSSVVGVGNCPTGAANVCKSYTSSLTCRPTTSTSGGSTAKFANIGQLVTWEATGSGTWSGDGVIGSPTGTTYSTRYSTIGKKVVLINGISCTTAVNGLPDGLPIINDPNFHEF